MVVTRQEISGIEANVVSAPAAKRRRGRPTKAKEAVTSKAEAVTVKTEPDSVALNLKAEVDERRPIAGPSTSRAYQPSTTDDHATCCAATEAKLALSGGMPNVRAPPQHVVEPFVGKGKEKATLSGQLQKMRPAM